MPLEKIRDLPEPCLSSEHNPPMHMVLSPGEYKWTCPSCGTVVKFIVQGFYCNNEYKNNITWINNNHEAMWRGKPLSALTLGEWNEFDSGGYNAIY